MNVESIARKALTILKLKWKIPESGFLAGGSIANTMWEIVSGNKAVVNDIDIFLFQDSIKASKSKITDKKNFEIKKVESFFYEDYQQLTSTTRISQSFTILEATKEGILNFVKYESKSKSPEIIIDSFDINCTQIGYSIDEDKFFWTKDFAEFLKTGELKITNLNTPAHSAIRIVKKKYDLSAKLDDFEIELLKFILDKQNDFIDINRVRFKDKYKNMFSQHIDFLGQHFSISKDEELMDYLSKKEIYDDIWRLTPKINESFDVKYGSLSEAPHILSELIFYIRNIYGKSNETENWQKLKQLYTIKDYISENNTEEEIKFVSDFTKSYPLTINQLRGLTLTQQFNLINRILKSTKDLFDYQTGIKILEYHKFHTDLLIDDEDLLLLELSVRKKPEPKRVNI